MATLADRVADTTLATYTALPRHGKPVVRSNGVNEWTILASISLTLPDNDTKVEVTSTQPATTSSNSTSPVRILPIALGTGVKVLPATRLPPLGDTLHDSHAEILARRGFVRWLLAEAERVGRGDGSGVLVWSREQGFMLADGVEVWLYVSALPCGDASTLHTASHQPATMAAAFRAAPELALPGDGAVRGRHGYETYGAIRTKPGRSDSPPSISFSCSDKIASWSVLGLQGALLAPLFAPVYLDYIVVGGVEEPADYKGNEQWGDLVKAEVDRALWQRLESIESYLTHPFRLSRPRVHLTLTKFQLSKSAVAARYPGTEPEPSPVSLSFVSVPGWKPEALVNGCTQGSAWKSPGTVLLKRGRSRLCKVEVLRAYLALRDVMAASAGWERDGQKEGPHRSVGSEVGSTVISADATYYALKHAVSAYQDTKALLRGSPGAPTSASWAARLPHTFLETVGTDGALGHTGHPPFEGWIVSGERFESFTAAGDLVPIAIGSVKK